MKPTKQCSVFFLSLILASLAGCATTDDSSDTRARDEDRGQRPSAYIDDSMITTKVKAAILNEPGLDSAEINVETYEGTVQLSGFVESQSDITRAVEVARRVEGVRSVKNDMRLKNTSFR